jgi:2-amino-4-hydroxy-6-hydroxymethyldihydropteridine diphosphokinase
MAEIFLGLGSNLGDREENLRRAEGALAPAVVIRKISSLYETEPQYVVDQPRFLNRVLIGVTALAPHALLAFLKRIESDLGRVPSERFGPRLVDLDILYYEDKLVNDAQLQIPHPRISEREFVLRPMLEIAPDFPHPQTGKTTSEMLKALDSRK